MYQEDGSVQLRPYNNGLFHYVTLVARNESGEWDLPTSELEIEVS